MDNPRYIPNFTGGPHEDRVIFGLIIGAALSLTTSVYDAIWRKGDIIVYG